MNGNPQKTLVPSFIELAKHENVMICGDDFKSGRTKMKSVPADNLIGCGIKIRKKWKYCHLGNNERYQMNTKFM